MAMKLYSRKVQSESFKRPCSSHRA